MILRQNLLLLGFLVVGFPGIITISEQASSGKFMEETSRQMWMDAPVRMPSLTMVPVRMQDGRIMMVLRQEPGEGGSDANAGAGDANPGVENPNPGAEDPNPGAEDPNPGAESSNMGAEDSNMPVESNSMDTDMASGSGMPMGGGEKDKPDKMEDKKEKKMEDKVEEKKEEKMEVQMEEKMDNMGFAPMFVSSIKLTQNLFLQSFQMGIQILTGYVSQIFNLFVTNIFGPASQILTTDGLPQIFLALTNNAGMAMQVAKMTQQFV